VTKQLLALLLLVAEVGWSQEILSDRIKGLRINGTALAGMPVADLHSQGFVVEFDVSEKAPPDLRVRVLHCDRNWEVTRNGFVNDDMQNKSKAPLPYVRVPDGVRTYSYHYSVRIPGIAGIDQFKYSGNYVVEILDEGWKTVLGRGRFFVVERKLPLTMKINNRSLPSAKNPFNQVKKIEVGFSIPPPEDPNGEALFPILLKVSDIYRNRQLYTPWRIDSDDRNPNTYIDGFGTSSLRFVVDNVAPGNAYRRIDLRDATVYPEDRILKDAKGADVRRFQMPPGSDNKGVSVLATGSRYADYVPFRFELASERPEWGEIYVVSDFNGWKVSKPWLMSYDEQTQRYVCDVSIRRGVYDYQYVVGQDDWIILEGNDWRTSSVYSAFMYYQETRLGGYDRIVGFLQQTSQ
jgi:hypothetical protein